MIEEYLARIEKAYLEILEDMPPADLTITLWLGLDGLRIREDGTLEWISRRKPKPEPIPAPPLGQVHVGMHGMQRASRVQLDFLENKINMLNCSAHQTQMDTILALSLMQNSISQTPIYPCWGDGRGFS